MNIYIISILLTGLLGFFTSWSGIFIGIISSSFMKDKGKRLKGTILGLLGGLMLGVVCFDLLPEAFGAFSIYIATTGIVIGLFFSVVLDGKLEHHNLTASKNNNNGFFKAAIFMAIGMGIHNLPTGIALGSLISSTEVEGFHLIVALILHGIPEGLALGILLNECNTSKYQKTLISVIISVPMGIGSILGGILNSPMLICISLSFASSMILYVTLRETLPAANETWKGRITTIGNVLGMVFGMLMVSLL